MRLLLVFILFPLFIYYPTYSQDWEQCEGVYGAYIKTMVTNGKVLLASTYDGIMFRSYDKGDTWERFERMKNDAGYVFDVTAMCINDKVIFVGTNVGVFRSEDNGDSWQLIGTEPHNIRSMTIKKEVLLITTSQGHALMSKDNGDTWTKMYENLSSMYGRIVFNDNTIYILDGKLHQSTDNGASWNIIEDSIIKNKDDKRLSGAIAASNGNIYVGANSALFRSTDDGETWANLIDIDSPGWDQETSVQSLYTAGDTVYVLSYNGVLRSFDKGENWQIIPIEYTPNVVLQNGTLIYVGTETGFSKSTDNGYSWEESRKGLNSVQVSDLIEIDETLLACTDIGISRSTDKGMSWSYVRNEPRRLFAYQLLKNTDYLFALGYYKFMRSGDKGVSWKEIEVGTKSIRSAVIQNENIFVTTDTKETLFKSTDNGETWQEIPSNKHLFRLHSSDGKNIFAVRREFPQKLFRSENNGESWEEISIENVNNYTYMATGDGVLFVLAGNTLFCSKDEGKNWEKISMNSNISSPLTVAYVKGVLFVSDDYGIYMSKDKGSTWEFYTFEYPINCVLPTKDNLFVGTLEYSLWKLPLNILSAPDYILNSNAVLEIAPNPTNSKCIIKSNTTNYKEVNVYNTLGQSLLTHKFESQETELDLSVLSVGEYNVVLYDGKRHLINKILIIR